MNQSNRLAKRILSTMKALIKEQSELFHFIISTPKNASYFVYFILESLEGLCFYSTLESDNKEVRLIDIKGTRDCYEDFLTAFNLLKKTIPIEVL